jgi:hypothetical protein
MSQLFAQVELLGNPGNDVYERLQPFMQSLYWYPTIGGDYGTSNLPDGTYQATNNVPESDVLAIANDLKARIESDVWSEALVLVIESMAWAQSGE